jgi:UDP-N-acetylglucosamine 1-carboxyvinyltransferase
MWKTSLEYTKRHYRVSAINLTDSLLIEGGTPLDGEVKVSGSKNALLSCIGGAIVTSGTVKILNVPLIEDLYSMISILDSLNVETKLNKKTKTMTVSAHAPMFEIPAEKSNLLRGAVMLLGGLLARTGHAIIHEYGGCKIGDRPIDLHLSAFHKMGAKFNADDKSVEISTSGLKGVKIYFRYPSVGATVNTLIAGCLATGRTTITNAAIEPEILNLTQLLESMGASIALSLEERVIEIDGVEELGNASIRLIPDRIEAGTYAAAAGITGGTLKLKDLDKTHLQAVFQRINDIGVHTEFTKKNEVLVTAKQKRLRGTEIETKPYPGFPTDLHPQFTAIATIAHGQTRINETVFESRFNYVNELRKFGARIKIAEGSIIIDGPTCLQGSSVEAPDLRGGVSLILAALAADGESHIQVMKNVDRGYENIDEKLRRVGAKIERI